MGVGPLSSGQMMMGGGAQVRCRRTKGDNMGRKGKSQLVIGGGEGREKFRNVGR